MTRIVIALVFVAAAFARAQEGATEGMPFGIIEDADVDRLQEFALKHGFDLKAEMERVYNQKKTDEDAVARVFVFSRQFNQLDANARAYGQIVYSALLNLGEVTDAYFKVLDRQPPDVQQRIRDFLYYPYLKIPKEHRNEAEQDRVYQMLFPEGFQFGRNDPIFAKET
jgi:hypothetical protein